MGEGWTLKLLTSYPPPPLWHGGLPPLFVRIPPPYMSGCHIWGIIPYITTLKF